MKGLKMKKITTYAIITLVYLLIFNELSAQNIPCDTVTQSSSGFDVNPLTNLINPLKSKNILTVQNIGCNNLRVRPDFIISHESQNLQINDWLVTSRGFYKCMYHHITCLF